MTKNNIKISIFGALIVAMILPFSGMPTAIAQVNEADPEDVIDTSKIAQFKAEPKMLTDTDIDKLAPKYLELEQDRNALLDSSETLSDSQQKVLSNIEEQMTAILERVAEHKRASQITLEMPTIDEKRMELSVEEILQSGLPISHVGINPHTKSVMVGIVDNGKEFSAVSYENQLNAFTSVDVPLTVYQGEYFKNEACTSQTGVICDPVVSGIQIEWANGECTLSLEVKEGWWPWANVGWLTAGHCYPVGAVGVDQPAGNNDIGDVTNQDYVNNGDCDCEFMDKTTTRSSGALMWLSSNNYKSVTSKGDASVNDYVLTSLGTSGGTDWGQVWLTEQTVIDNQGKRITGLTFVTGINSGPGDSGAPYMQLFGNQYHGIHKGAFSINGNQVTGFSPWSNISPSLGVY